MKCVFCEQEFTPKRSTAQFCSTACRVKQARKKAAEEGDDSVEWKPDDEPDVSKPVTLPKKPSKSPTVLLKQKVKERILTKSAGKVGTSEGPSTTSGEEIPADSDVPPAESRPRPDWTELSGDAGIKLIFHPKVVTFLPVENHGSTNDLARSVISKVKSAKPASDLDRLERSQLRGKPKGPSSTRSSE